MKKFDKEWFEKIFEAEDSSLYLIYSDISDIFTNGEYIDEERASS
ncbi:hypothetical protein [Bacillus paramycoides]|uniref:Uncharacterized protein n=1 Tax=Bacillus paramycoides TaxID=2026194 RepID=A0ABU6N426_9BACI|nr:hypothetical protein [Bacillus paramycoides]